MATCAQSPVRTSHENICSVVLPFESVKYILGAPLVLISKFTHAAVPS